MNDESQQTIIADIPAGWENGDQDGLNRIWELVSEKPEIAELPPWAIAERLHTPSYISFDYALGLYRMITRNARSITCASSSVRGECILMYQGCPITYRWIPARVASLGVTQLCSDDPPVSIATPEKALCDLLYRERPVRSYAELEFVMFEILDIDDDEVFTVDADRVATYAEIYRSTTLKVLARYLRHGERLYALEKYWRKRKEAGCCPG